MPTTLSIGGATYDLFISIDEEHITDDKFNFALGDKVRLQNVQEACGGGASNTSVGLARLGLSAGFAGVVGDDQWGENLLQNLQAEGVDVAAATVVEEEVSSFSLVLLSPNGERSILYDPGTNEHLHDVTFNRERAGEVDWVYLNHIQPQSCVIQDDLVDIFMSNDAPRLTWNPGGSQIDAGVQDKHLHTLVAHTTCLLLNKKEALAFTKTDSGDAALELLSQIGAQYVFITDGCNGTIATDGDAVYSCPVEACVIPVDTTGAGDAFGSGITWAMSKGYDLPTALKAGTISSASVVQAVGAQTNLLTETDMLSRLDSSTLVVQTR